MPQLIFKFQANMQKRVITKNYFYIIAAKTQVRTVDSFGKIDLNVFCFYVNFISALH